MGRAMPGDGTDHITPVARATQARGILLELLGHSVIPLGITDFIPLKAVLALALVFNSICLASTTSKRDRLTALWWAGPYSITVACSSALQISSKI